MPDIDTVRGGVGVDPDDELDNLCQHSHALTPCPDVDVDGRSGPDARQDCYETRPTSLGRSSSYSRPAPPVPGRSRQQRADKSAA